MSRFVCVTAFCLVLILPSWSAAREAAPPISDREIIERLARLEEGQKALRQGQDSLRQGQDSLRQGQDSLRQEMQQLRQEMQAQMQQFRQEMSGQVQQLRQEMNMQIQQLRTDMNAQFSYVFQLMIGMLGAFAAIVAVTITFALWDRRTMIRPFEDKIKAIEEDLSQNHQRFHALLEALRSLSIQDRRLAEVLKQFDLL